MIELAKEIDVLKIELDKKDRLLEDLREETSNYHSVGHLKAHISDLNFTIEEKTRENLDLHTQLQKYKS